MAEKREPESWINRIELMVALVLQISILVITVSALIRGQWLGAFSGSIVLLLTFAPALIERHLRVPLPVELTLITCVFLYASFALGEVRDFYEKIWWWDLALHGMAALTIGIIGFLSIYVFYMTQRIQIAAGWIATITGIPRHDLGDFRVYDGLELWFEHAEIGPGRYNDGPYDQCRRCSYSGCDWLLIRA